MTGLGERLTTASRSGPRLMEALSEGSGALQDVVPVCSLGPPALLLAQGWVSWREPVISSLCALHSLDPSERFMELYREEKRKEVDRGDQEEKRGNQKERDRYSQ